MSRIGEKFVGEGSGTRSRWSPNYSRYQRQGWEPSSPFSPHFFGRRGEETEVARKEWPASQKLSPLPRARAEEVVVAPLCPSPIRGAR